MKILFYNHTGQVSGAERVLLQILKGLDRDRFDFVVACPPGSRLAEMTTQLDFRTAEVVSLNARFTWRVDLFVKYLASFVAVIRAARTAVEKESPDLVHANSIRAGLVMTAATVGLNIPVIWHAHDILPRHPFSAAIRFLALAFRRHHVIAVSQAVADRFRGALLRPRGSSRVTVVHNAVDANRFQPNLRAGHEARRALGLSESDFVIGSIGQLTPRKGQLELIEAFARVAREIPTLSLLLVGAPLFNEDAAYANSLERRVNALDLTEHVQFLGSRDDVPALMQALDVLVVNSQQEPFALTVLEGFASGVPVVATSVGGTPEMICHAYNGWLISSCDPQELATALMRVIADPDLRKTLSARGRVDAVAKFSTKKFLEEIKCVYRMVLARGKMPHKAQTQPRTELSAD